jgi:hypothetical protein
MSVNLVRCLALVALAAAAAAGCRSRDAAPITPAPGAASSEDYEPGRLEQVGTGASEAVTAARQTTREGLPGAATAPLEDLNITREEIPPNVASIAYVYTAYPPPDCGDIAAEIARLDTELGCDYDVEAEANGSLGRRGGEAAGDLVVDTIRGVATDVIPFRSIVREASGAASYERRRARAFAAGYARRAYLKGLALGQGCSPPAAPLVITPPVEESSVEVRETRDAPANENWGPPSNSAP